MSWSEVYRVGTCGNCNKAGCPDCAGKFLKYLTQQGSSPQGPLE